MALIVTCNRGLSDGSIKLASQLICMTHGVVILILSTIMFSLHEYQNNAVQRPTASSRSHFSKAWWLSCIQLGITLSHLKGTQRNL